MGRRGDPPEFRGKVLDLVEAGRLIAQVAQALGISTQSVYGLSVRPSDVHNSCPESMPHIRR